MRSRFLSRFVTTIAELAQDMAGHEIEIRMTFDGRGEVFRPGLSGQILNALYDQRLRDLNEKIARTPMGCAVLDFLAQQNTRIDFDHRLPANGRADPGNVIALRSGLNDAGLMGTLVHEARHIWQLVQIKEEMRHILPPSVEADISRLVEADAMSFQQKFVENYARETGDEKPLRAFYQQRGKNIAPIGLDDRARFLHWALRVGQMKGYHKQEQQHANHAVVRARNADLSRTGLSVEDALPLLLSAARKIGKSWPFSGADGQAQAFLDEIDATVLSDICRRGPAQAKGIAVAQADYMAALERRAAAAALPKAAPGSRGGAPGTP